MKSVWRKHLIICLVLGLLAVPIYFLDRALLGGGGGGNWIALDFRGLIFWTYITFIAIDVTVSSIAVLLFPKSGALRIQVGSMFLSVILLVAGLFGYEQLRLLAIANQEQRLMENRRPLLTAIELKQRCDAPD